MPAVKCAGRHILLADAGFECVQTAPPPPPLKKRTHFRTEIKTDETFDAIHDRGQDKK